MGASGQRVVRAIEGFIEAQYAANAQVTLSQIARGACDPYRVHSGLIPFVRSEREALLDVLRAEIDRAQGEGSRLVDLFVSSTKEYIYRNNQFITLSARQQWGLAQLYLEFVADLAGALAHVAHPSGVDRGFQTAIDRHLAALHAFVVRLEEEQGDGSAALVHTRVACEEYSARLQLTILGMDVDRIAGPVLDIGCGKRGELVCHLRALGIEAYGIDRLVLPNRHLAEADWLEYPLRPASWGTILSHMAFSNHFVFHHLYRDGVPEVYAARYMALLAALRPGGSLYYAPGLPFIEPLLPPEQYHVSRKALDVPGWVRQELAGADPMLQNDLVYSTRVTRIR